MVRLSHGNPTGFSGVVVDVIGENFFAGELRGINLLYHFGERLAGGIVLCGQDENFVDAAGQDVEVASQTFREVL